MTPSPEHDVAAMTALRDVKDRVAALGLLSRTSISFAFLFAMGADFLLLSAEESWARGITVAQSALFLIALWSVLRTRPAPEGPRGLRGEARFISHLVVIAAVAVLALAQKWWIVLQVGNAARPAYAGSYRVMGATITFAGVFLLLGQGQRMTRFFLAFAEQPARQAAFSFFALAMFGAFLLTLPICVRNPSHVSFLDALFMATSAVCVTGLAVHEVAREYTFQGQAVLLGLVQVGGLGIMVLSASFIVLTGRKLRVRSSAALAEVLDADSLASLRGNILRIIGFTFAIEALGALALYLSFVRHPEVALGVGSPHPMAGSASLLWAAIFHAVSAFCNAGFALMHGGLVPFASSYAVCTVIMTLIVLGGLGFPVLSELARWLSARVRRIRPARLSLHTRIVVPLNAMLIVGVALAFVGIEWSASLAGKAWYDRAFSALFQSITLRTAGFNTVDIENFSDAGLMVAMLFMIVGASPGGTGGGLKVTTFAVLFATLRAELRNAPEPYLLDRRLPPSTVRRAISVWFVAAFVLTFSVLSLLLSERADAIRLAFEAVSAFGTVGLSAGVTGALTSVGKLVIIVTMLIGRVGPLTVALATAERKERAHHLRPHERVLIG